MNYRDYKIFVKDGYYHIFNRGVGKMNIFNDTADFVFFIRRLNENLFPKILSILDGHHPDGAHQGASTVAETHTPYIRKSLPPKSFTLLSYALMPNHFHFLIRQNTDLPISKLLLKICGSYSKYYNKKYERVGSLFQDQFKAVRIETDEQLTWTSSYIHNNPKVAGLVADAQGYPWSSYPDYLGLRNGVLCEKDFILKMFPGKEAYKKFTNDSFEKIKERKHFEHLLLD